MADIQSKKANTVTLNTAAVKIHPVMFAMHAEEFLIAAKYVPKKSEAKGNTTFTPVPFFLVGRSLELILKAFLLTKGFCKERLASRRYGHNLIKLWNEAKAHDVFSVTGEVNSCFEDELHQISALYSDKIFEHFDFRHWAACYEEIPQLERFQGDVQRIVIKAKKYVVSIS